MKLGTKIFFCFLIIFSVCFYYPLNWMVSNLRVRYLEGVEEPVVDQATLLAAMVGSEMEQERFDPEKFYATFQSASLRVLTARIYDLEKTRMDMHVYITDEKGRVIFHSQDKKEIGKDYSTWRDVRLTLKGEYGARTTQSDESEPTSSVLYVASPIIVNGSLAGVLTVAKPTTNINTFLKGARPRIIKKWLFFLFVAILLSWAASVWLTNPIKRLTEYANKIKDGKRPPFPELGSGEIGEMGLALKKMQETIEGKNYIEQYIQSFTHEVKSPLSAIRGAAELLEEKMEKAQRLRFLTNIRSETNRIQVIVDKMLELSTLENLNNLQKIETISTSSLINNVLESKRLRMLHKNITPQVHITSETMIKGDVFLLQQAIGNLIENSIDFSPPSSSIQILTDVKKNNVLIRIEDQGPGIPEYAQGKIFTKFFSLKRPDTGQKSTGLGLNFVKEVALLHNGSVHLETLPGGGVGASLTIPV